MSGGFEQAYERFMERQIEESRGERRRRLLEEDRHAERLLCKNVWWPMFGNFDHVHAEWEVPDLRSGYRYLDHAFLRLPLKLSVEIEGFGVHAKNADRRKFEDDHLRAAYLQAEGWQVVRFSYDTVKDRPQVCRQILQLLIGRWTGFGSEEGVVAFTVTEKAVIRLAILRQSPITPGDVCDMTGVCNRTARRCLQSLVDKGAFRPARGKVRIRAYELCSEKSELFLGML